MDFYGPRWKLDWLVERVEDVGGRRGTWSAEGGIWQYSTPRVVRTGSIPRSTLLPHHLACTLTAKLTAKGKPVGFS